MITKEQIIQDLQKFHDQFGKFPTTKTYYRDWDHYCTRTIRKIFGSWNNAMDAAFGKHNRDRIGITCKVCSFCGKTIIRQNGRFEHHQKNHFCSRSCSVFFNNKLKRKSRKSKCEKALFDLLSNEFKDIEFISGDKTMLDGYEIDIAVPSLNLGIEWNGIVHFKPIFGNEKFRKVLENDYKKQQIAEKKGIHLIVIPDLISKKTIIEKAFLEISSIIRKLTLLAGIEPDS